MEREDQDYEGFTWVSLPESFNLTDESKFFILDPYRYETCAVSQDLLLHPVIKGFLIVVGALWVLIVCTLACLFSKYRNLKYRYSQLGEEPGNVN